MWAERHAADVIGSLERDVLPYLGTEIQNIISSDVKNALRMQHNFRVE